METRSIHPAQLEVDVFNPRKSVDTKAIEQLAANIHSLGVLSPLVCRPPHLPLGVEPLDESKLRFTVLCGSRRLAAAKHLGLSSVPIIVREMSDAEAAEVALTEQSSHETLSALEIADAISKWKDAGVTPEEIGRKLDRKKAWVYATIQLTSLTPEAKRALTDARIEESTARDLAAVPSGAQGVVLKELLRPGLSGPLTTRECKEIISSFRHDVSKAPFDPNDITLSCSEHSGACTTCPFLSGARPELFEDAAKNPNICTSPNGYASKSDASWARRVDDGDHNRAPKCLSEKQSVKYFDPAGNIRDDAPYVDAKAICFSDTAQRPYSALLGPAPEKHYVLARSPKGAVVELVGRAKLDELLQEAGKIRRAPAAIPKEPDDDEPKVDPAERKRLEEKRRRRMQANLLGNNAAIDIVRKRGMTKELYRFAANCQFNQGAVSEEVQAHLDIKEKPSTYLERLKTEADLAAFVFRNNVSFNTYMRPGSDKYPDGYKELLAMTGLDPKTFENQVVAAEKAQPKKTKKAVKQ